jgi:hypothetical protein
MLVILGLFLVVLGASAYGLRAGGEGPRWPFLVAFVLSGGVILVGLTAAAIAWIGGRGTWNSWASGSQSSETLTLWVVLIVGPVLLATCCGLLIFGASRHTSTTRP